MKYIGVIGSRKRNSLHDLLWCTRKFFEIYEEGDIIVSGGCPEGGDRFAELLRKVYNIPIVTFPADWIKNGKAAGFIRNSDIAAKSDVILAIVTKDRIKCKGTMDTVNKALKLGKTVIFDENEEEIEEEEFDPEKI